VTNLPWWAYVALAGLSWGTYVPIIFYGGTELSTRPGTIGGRLAAILCVGVAYFVLGVLLPVLLMATRDDARPDWKANGLVFSGLAGVAGAVGAICVVFASSSAVRAAKAEPAYAALEARKAAIDQEVASGPAEDTAGRKQESAALKAEMDTYAGKYRLFIAPLIFGLAPVINTLLASLWHPKPGSPWHFEFEPPGWKLVAGILLVGVGAFLVLYSKEEAEEQKKKAMATPKPAAVAVNPAPPAG
jgi:drug/metabolite transporter (DMT)-like permease